VTDEDERPPRDPGRSHQPAQTHGVLRHDGDAGSSSHESVEDAPRHTVTYTRRRFMIMLGGAAAVATGFYELARQFGGPDKSGGSGSGASPRPARDFPSTAIDDPPHVLLRDWTVQIGGLVETPIKVDFGTWSTLPRVTETADFQCVEGWGASDVEWTGVRPADLLALAKPLPKGTFVRFSTKSGRYFDTLSMAQLTDGYSLLADTLDGQPLPPDHGGPLRLVVPTQLGYKSVKFVSRIEVVEVQEKGYWEQGGYAVDAPAQP
jgi:DMSO/TMAO reductase YedYZ molybdopterin-dependent catalytic subunit